MLETISIISNGIIIVAIGILWRKVDNQEKVLNEHLINFTSAVVQRPNFDQMNDKVEKISIPMCKKIKELAEDFRHHVHEGSKAKPIL